MMENKDKKKTTAVAEKAKTDLSTDVMNLAADSEMGLEGADASSYALPFLLILQSKSPQVEKELIDGAKAGMLMNNITNELYDVGPKGDDKCLIIPCSFKKTYIQWQDRKNGGELKGVFTPFDLENGKIPGLDIATMSFPDTHAEYPDQLKDTRTHFVLVKTKSGSWEPAIFVLKSTQIKKSKNFMALIQSRKVDDENGRKVTPASFSHIYSVKSVFEEGRKGSWHGVNIELVKRLDVPGEDDDLYRSARKLSIDAKAGLAKPAEDNKL